MVCERIPLAPGRSTMMCSRLCIATFANAKNLDSRNAWKSSAYICGTDLHEYLERPFFAPTADAPHPLTGEAVPITLGHEFAGVVHDLGDGVDDVHVGDRVVVEPYIICGHCDACTQGRYNVCQSGRFRRPVGFRGRGLAVRRREIGRAHD